MQRTESWTINVMKISVICFIINYSLVKCTEPSTSPENERNQNVVGYDKTRDIKRLDLKTIIAVDEPNELKSMQQKSNVGNKLSHQVKKYIDEPIMNESNKQHRFTAHESNFTAEGSSNLFHIFMNLYDHQSWNLLALKHKISYDCAADMQIYLQHLKSQINWAVKVFDSSGHYGGQSLFGNDFWLGSKSFCEEINKESVESKIEPFVHMSFFVAIVRANIYQLSPEPKTLHLGQCLPKSCSKEDVYIILKDDPNSILLKHKLTCKITNSSSQMLCDPLEIVNIRNVPGSYSLYEDIKFYILCVTIIILAVIILLSSYQESMVKIKSKIHQNDQIHGSLNGLEKWMEKNNLSIELNTFNRNNNNTTESSSEATVKDCNKIPASKFFEILQCFSIRSNSHSILSISASNKDSITCIHGLRLYSLLWTIMVHTYLQLYAVGENRYRRTITERSFIYQIVGNATFSVDTFFFISGMLVVILFYRSTQKRMNTENEKILNRSIYISKTTFKISISILYRYLRLTPAYLFVILFNELALKWTYEKSVFTPGIIDHITCNKYWWRNILYINNWYPFNEMCMIWSWYLANDMQLYVVAIVLLTISIRFMKTSILLLSLITICSWITSIYLSIIHNYSYKVAEPFGSFDILYDKPWQRITPYIMGMLTGYIIHFKKTPPKVSAVVNCLMWITSVSIIFGLIFGVWDGQLSVPATAIYVSLGHTAWGAALIWITLSCCWGYSPFINNLLSYRGIHPLSRLSYCAYLLHPVIMMITSFQLEAPMHLQHGIIITVFFGNAVLSFMLAYFVSLMFEAPVIKLLKLAFKHK